MCEYGFFPVALTVVVSFDTVRILYFVDPNIFSSVFFIPLMNTNDMLIDVILWENYEKIK